MHRNTKISGRPTDKNNKGAAVKTEIGARAQDEKRCSVCSFRAIFTNDLSIATWKLAFSCELSVHVIVDVAFLRYSKMAIV